MVSIYKFPFRRQQGKGCHLKKNLGIRTSVKLFANSQTTKTLSIALHKNLKKFL
jgi:hypothetical protein